MNICMLVYQVVCYMIQKERNSRFHREENSNPYALVLGLLIEIGACMSLLIEDFPPPLVYILFCNA